MNRVTEWVIEPGDFTPRQAQIINDVIVATLAFLFGLGVGAI